MKRVCLFLVLGLVGCTSLDSKEEVGTTATISTTAASSPAQGYAADVRIVWTLAGESNDVTLGNTTKDWKYHGAYTPSDYTREFASLAPWNFSFATKPGLQECYSKASQYVGTINGSGWSVDKDQALTAHCWFHGVWANCGTQSFDTHIFPLLKNGNAHFDYLNPTDATANVERKIDVLFYVVVGPPRPDA